MVENIVLDDSVLSVFGDIRDPEWLSEYDAFEVREVGGLHNLSINDKVRWARKHTPALRIVEKSTGREEIWFARKVNYPQFVSLNHDGAFQSHNKFASVWLPAIHFPAENLLGTNWSGPHTTVEDDNPYYPCPPVRTVLNIWCDQGDIHSIKTNVSALEAKSMVFKPRDPKAADYIDFFFFEEVNEYWEQGVWKNTMAAGLRIFFHKTELNTRENHKKMQKWLQEHCQHGFFPFGDPLFGSEEEEFLFITEFCT